MSFQLVFDMLVLQKHNTEMTTAAGEAFYTLVCLHQVPDASLSLHSAPTPSRDTVGAGGGPSVLPVLKEPVTQRFCCFSEGVVLHLRVSSFDKLFASE